MGKVQSNDDAEPMDDCEDLEFFQNSAISFSRGRLPYIHPIVIG